MTDNLWDSHGLNGQDLQSKKLTENLRDSHGLNGQDLQSKNVTENFSDFHTVTLFSSCVERKSYFHHFFS